MNATELNMIIELKGKYTVPASYYHDVNNLIKSGYSHFAASRASVQLIKKI